MNKLILPCLFCLAMINIQAQVSFTNMPGVISSGGMSDCVADMNGDFLDDIVTINSSVVKVYLQQADGSFNAVTHNISLNNLPDWSICAGDIDGNGINDLLLGSGSRASFLYANADGSAYTEFVEPSYIFCQRSTFADINADGHLDAFVCNDVEQNFPFLNDGSGNLTLDHNVFPTNHDAGNYSALWVDYDNDWDQDLYISKCILGSSPGDPDRTNLLYQNNGDGTFTEVAEAANLADNDQSWTTIFQDFDNDGDFDAFTVNHYEANRLYRNNGDGTFTDVIEGSGINASDLGAWECNSGDFNNDGYVDILAQHDNELYINNGDWTFTPQSLQFSSGGIGDLNNDGFLDVQRGSNIFLNDGNENNWVKINPIGLISNRNGIGARVEIHGEWGIQIREVRAGTSFSSMSSLCVHFGLGQATTIDQIVIRWPSGAMTMLENPAINTTHDMYESNCEFDPMAINITGDLQICPGEVVGLEAPAGFMSYQWSNGSTTQAVTVSEGGDYSCILSNEDGCITITEIVEVIEVEEVIPVIIYDGGTSVCAGSIVTLTAGNGTNYTWSDGSSGESVEVTTSGSYTVSADANCQAAQVMSAPLELTFASPDLPVIGDISAAGNATYEVTAAGPDLHWYDLPEGGSLLATGTSFTTPELTADATYYVESHIEVPGAIQSGGKPDNQGGGGLSPASDAFSLFDAWEPFTLKEVTVYKIGSGSSTTTIQLADAVDNILAEVSFELTAGQHTLTLDFEVPSGMELSLRCPENNLFRNNYGVNYPYPIGDVGELTTSSFGTAYYYHFYNWLIQKSPDDCISGRVAVEILLNDISHLQNINNVQLFPNPSDEIAVLAFNLIEHADVSLRLYDLSGKLVWNRASGGVSAGVFMQEIPVNNLPKGMYQLELDIGHEVAQLKLIVQ